MFYFNSFVSYSLKFYFADSEPFEHITLLLLFTIMCTFFGIQSDLFFLFHFLDCSLERSGMCRATNVSHLLLRVRKPHVKDKNKRMGGG